MKILAVKLTGQEIADIVTTAFEGGINYWCEKADREPASQEHDERERVMEAPIYAEGGFWKEHYPNDADAACRLSGYRLYLESNDGDALLTAAGVEQAVNTILNNIGEYGYVANQIVTNDIDAEGADIIVQLAVFGKVVYC